MFPSQRILANMGITIFWGRGPGIRATLCTYSQILLLCIIVQENGRQSQKRPPSCRQGGRLGGKRGVKAVQVEVFLPGTDDPPSLGRYPALCFVTRGCSSFGFVGLGILIIAFIRMFQMYFGGEGDFEVANR